MSAESFAGRLPQSAPGRFYIDDCCMICALCEEGAPSLFGYDKTAMMSFVKRQPETAEELELMEKAMDVCHMEAIHSDGDQFDPETPPRPVTSSRLPGNPSGPRCCGS